jgi:hypothetical protein
MMLHGSSAPRYEIRPVGAGFQSGIRLPGSNLGVSLQLSNNVRHGMSMGMLNRISNARPGCSSCGGGH